MKLRQVLLDRRIDSQIDRVVGAIVPYLDEARTYYPVQIGTTPRTIARKEHIMRVAEGTLERLGNLGVKPSLEYDAIATANASLVAKPGSYMGAPLGIEIIERPRPIVVFLNPDLVAKSASRSFHWTVPYCPPGGIVGVDYGPLRAGS